jgi:hypothetical protein
MRLTRHRVVVVTIIAAADKQARGDPVQEDDMAYYGIYRGSLINTADPQMKGRVQVNVPSVGTVATNWAAPCREYRSTAMPPIGTSVWVMFESGDPAYPVWMGCMN